MLLIITLRGVVNVQFGVDEKGNISNVNCRIKIGYGLKEEAIRVVSKLPKYVPGQVKGKM
ncbi:MAG: energy transducer TonB [Chitinophagaceae bacterium]